MNDVTYSYKPKAWIMGLGALFFGACSAMLFHTATTNDAGLIINGLIVLSKPHADIFYYVLLGASLLLTLGGLFGVYAGLTQSAEIRLSDDAFTAPKRNYSTQLVTIPYASIEQLQQQGASGQEWVVIYHSGGKMTLMKSMFRNKEAYYACLDDLIGRIDQTQARQ